MIDGFEVGKTYQFTGDKAKRRPWSNEMKKMYDGVPRVCTKVDHTGLSFTFGNAKMFASFEGIEINSERCWDFRLEESNFTEVK